MASLTGAISGIYTKKLAKRIDTFLMTAYQLLIGSFFYNSRLLRRSSTPYLYKSKHMAIDIFGVYISSSILHLDSITEV